MELDQNAAELDEHPPMMESDVELPSRVHIVATTSRVVAHYL